MLETVVVTLIPLQAVFHLKRDPQPPGGPHTSLGCIPPEA